LFVAVENDHPNVVKLLLDAGAELNTPDNQGRTVMVLVEQSGNDAMLQVLRKGGARA